MTRGGGRRFLFCALFALAACLASSASSGQTRPQPQGLPRPQPAPAPPLPLTAVPKAVVERLGPNLYAVGRIRVDGGKREISVTGKINDVTTLEFVANTANGFKAYESALTLDADAITFNTALLLIGLDAAHARVPVRHFDPNPPQGDPVEILVEWANGAERKRVRVEQLLFDKRTNQPLPEGPWVYTGSSFLGQRYLADLDGVLIGFAHSPSPIIENPGAGTVGAYGSVVLNRDVIAPGTQVTLIVRALSAETGPLK